MKIIVRDFDDYHADHKPKGKYLSLIAFDPGNRYPRPQRNDNDCLAARG